MNIIKTHPNAEIVLEGRHEGDIGFDLRAVSCNIVGNVIGHTEGGNEIWGRIDYLEYDTGIIVEPDPGVFTFMFPRSSISKTWLQLANSVGLIDSGYRGHIKLRFRYLFQNPGGFVLNMDKIYHKGDKIAQAVFAKSINDELQFNFTDSFEETSRSDGGFGSTGS